MLSTLLVFPNEISLSQYELNRKYEQCPRSRAILQYLICIHNGVAIICIHNGIAIIHPLSHVFRVPDIHTDTHTNRHKELHSYRLNILLLVDSFREYLLIDMSDRVKWFILIDTDNRVFSKRINYHLHFFTSQYVQK